MAGFEVCCGEPFAYVTKWIARCQSRAQPLGYKRRRSNKHRSLQPSQHPSPRTTRRAASRLVRTTIESGRHWLLERLAGCGGARGGDVRVLGRDEATRVYSAVGMAASSRPGRTLRHVFYDMARGMRSAVGSETGRVIGELALQALSSCS